MNVFLYHVGLTADQRNDALPTRDLDVRAMADPTVALDLDYVVGFAGARNTSESELLLSAAMSTFYNMPMISEEVVGQALNGLAQSGLATSDLTYPVRISPLSLSTDERSMLWSMFFQVPYCLSVEYRVRAVFVPAHLRDDRT